MMKRKNMRATICSRNSIYGGLTSPLRYCITNVYYACYLFLHNFGTVHRCICNIFKNPGKNKFILSNLAIPHPWNSEVMGYER